MNFFEKHMKYYEAEFAKRIHRTKGALAKEAEAYVEKSEIGRLTKRELIHEIADGVAMEKVMAEDEG